jgi:hypothetical protein
MAKAKDERLTELAARFNVAQFVSFSAGISPLVRNYRIYGYPPDVKFTDTKAAIAALLKASTGAVNVRSFRVGQDKGNPFEYGITTAERAAATVRKLAGEGYYTIVNETIDTDDGGVSGVMLGGILEFTPFDTPRGVEKPGTVSVPYQLGIEILSTIYGFRPDLVEAIDARVEFSVHPMRVGYRRGHTLHWEIEAVQSVDLTPRIVWPNRLSRHIGDKAFGLLIAHLLDLPVPRTTVIPRAVAPFKFGRPTGTTEFWMRTCPREPQPGRFTTRFGWHDPYKVMAAEDPDESVIASVLAQEGVEAVYSGASLPAGEERNYVEGVAGRGDDFMQGIRKLEPLPDRVIRDVQELASRAKKVLGPVRLEWIHDGNMAWAVQLQLTSREYRPSVINPGDPENGWLEFDPASGLVHLNDLISRARLERRGVRIIAPVGITSHVGDLLRRASIPARLDIQD